VAEAAKEALAAVLGSYELACTRAAGLVVYGMPGVVAGAQGGGKGGAGKTAASKPAAPKGK
jgi:hypothetical protein